MQLIILMEIVTLLRVSTGLLHYLVCCDWPMCGITRICVSKMTIKKPIITLLRSGPIRDRSRTFKPNARELKVGKNRQPNSRRPRRAWQALMWLKRVSSTVQDILMGHYNQSLHVQNFIKNLPKVACYPAYQNSTINNGFHRAVFEIKHIT